jgi:hypothetical protein
MGRNPSVLFFSIMFDHTFIASLVLQGINHVPQYLLPKYNVNQGKSLCVVTLFNTRTSEETCVD